MTPCHAPYNFDGKMKRFYNSSIARGDRVIAISRYVADYLKKNYPIDESKIRVIHRGIALEKFHPTVVMPAHLIKISAQWRLPDDASIVMMPGRITRWKGHHVLIEAMSKLNRDDVFCILIGSDQGRTEYRKELEQTIEEKGLGGRIRIIDHWKLDTKEAAMASSSHLQLLACNAIPMEGPFRTDQTNKHRWKKPTAVQM